MKRWSPPVQTRARLLKNVPLPCLQVAGRRTVEDDWNSLTRLLKRKYRFPHFAQPHRRAQVVQKPTTMSPKGTLENDLTFGNSSGTTFKKYRLLLYPQTSGSCEQKFAQHGAPEQRSEKEAKCFLGIQSTYCKKRQRHKKKGVGTCGVPCVDVLRRAP